MPRFMQKTLSSNEYNIFLRDLTIYRSPTIKSSRKNMINNHKHSVQVIEREDVNGGLALKVNDRLNKNNTSDVYYNEITLPLSIPHKTTDHDVPYILPINSQGDLSRSTRTNSDKKEQLFHSFVTNNSSDINPINKTFTKNSASNPTKNIIQHNTRIKIDLENQMHVTPIYNTDCTQNKTPYSIQSSVKGPLRTTINTYKKNSDITTNIPN